MNYRLVSKYLGVVCLLIGVAMACSLPWAFRGLGYRSFEGERLRVVQDFFERDGFLGLLAGILLCTVIGLLFRHWGKSAPEGERVYRKEAMAAVGVSWVLATILGAVPFVVGRVQYTPAVKLQGAVHAPLVFKSHMYWRNQWSTTPARADGTYLDEVEYQILEILISSADGRTPEQLVARMENKKIRDVEDLVEKSQDVEQTVRGLVRRSPWDKVLVVPRSFTSDDRLLANRIRVEWIHMDIVDALFESQSGFSTTGATIISDLENPRLVPHCLLFWRSTTHFLGGLGIIVLFVVLLGQGSAGKALMRAEMPGPTKEGSTARIQHTAWIFAAIYLALNLILTIILMGLGMTVFDALCHAFGTMATGGFSTYNTSVGYFDSAAIDYVIIVFMLLAGTNFTLLYLLILRKPGMLLADVEWRTYIGLILLVTVLVVAIGVPSGDFDVQEPLVRDPGNTAGEIVENVNSTGQKVNRGVRYGLFQVVAIITTTGFGTHDFDGWNNFGRGVLLLLMFVGGCAGSTGGGMKVIRHVLFVKILRLEIEKAYRPSVVRPLLLGDKAVEDHEMRHGILVYFGLVLLIFMASWIFVVTVEPASTWGPEQEEHKLVDSASAVAATLNNIGPGLGTVGATQNYSTFSPLSKLLFTWLMMLGRLELFSILVLTSVNFWRNR
ncbi:MAG: TrkH family potassium uptake protein [Pirellulaceae bacterium]